jgi:hypothetical protein
MVTHDLRMCRYVDRVIQMVDGRVARVIEDPLAIQALAGSSQHSLGEAVEAPQPAAALPIPFPARPAALELSVAGD